MPLVWIIQFMFVARLAWKVRGQVEGGEGGKGVNTTDGPTNEG